MTDVLSKTMISNLYTMGLASANDVRQIIPEGSYVELTEEQRVLRARLILEEALEACSGLGVHVGLLTNRSEQSLTVEMADLEFEPVIAIGDGPGKDKLWVMDKAEVIDACCDTVYVCVGTLAAMGVPDLPHLAEVCRANNAKFPNGTAITDKDGKFQKPAGWTPPDHEKIRQNYHGVQLACLSRDLIEEAKKKASPS